MGNTTMIQFFEWNLPADGRHWQRLKNAIPELARMGIHGVWIPPPTKGQSPWDVGYGIYDLWDLGEFWQKGAIRTKYGTKQELKEAIKVAKEHGVEVYADIVLNHKAGADRTERFLAKEVDPNNRKAEITAPYNIEGWTGFNFTWRGNKYSDFKWHSYHFTGVDWDHKHRKKAIFLIEGNGKSWSDNVDNEMGNSDYLMFSDIDYSHPEVVEETKKWGVWFVNELGIDGFRIDAIKHIDSVFMKDFLEHVRINTNKPDFFAVGESWKHDLGFLISEINHFESKITLFDVPLHSHFAAASHMGRDYDLTKIFNGTLVNSNPLNAVTFVENHDTQPGCAFDGQRVSGWFKPLAYALILLRTEGYPCVFYGDLYGLHRPHKAPPVPGLARILELRRSHAYGTQEDYFDHSNTIGWVRKGEEGHGEGLAVVVSNGDDGEKKMKVGKERRGQVWVDLMGITEGEVVIDEEGWGLFKVKGGKVAAWGNVSARENVSACEYVPTCQEDSISLTLIGGFISAIRYVEHFTSIALEWLK